MTRLVKNGELAWRTRMTRVALAAALMSVGACAFDDIDHLYGEADLFVDTGPGNAEIDPEKRLRLFPQYLTRADLRHPEIGLPVRTRIIRRRMEEGLVALLHRRCSAQTVRCAVRELERLDFSCRETSDRAECVSVRKTRDPRISPLFDPHFPQAWSVSVEGAEHSTEIRAHVRDLPR